jgi:hypothetical protein
LRLGVSGEGPRLCVSIGGGLGSIFKWSTRWGAVYCTALHCTALHSTLLHCTALYCTALHCTALHQMEGGQGHSLYFSIRSWTARLQSKYTPTDHPLHSRGIRTCIQKHSITLLVLYTVLVRPSRVGGKGQRLPFTPLWAVFIYKLYSMLESGA